MDMDSRFPDMKWKIKTYPNGSEEWRLVRPSPNGEDRLVAGFYCGPGARTASRSLAKLAEDNIEIYRTIHKVAAKRKRK